MINLELTDDQARLLIEGLNLIGACEETISYQWRPEISENGNYLRDKIKSILNERKT